MEPKIFLLGVHPPRHRNIGDFAQTWAIRKWFEDSFPGQLVFEFEKSWVTSSLSSIKVLTNENDLIFINSGGDMGDRWPRWEKARTRIVETFCDNRIVSLPQTIYYSDTEHGRKVLKESAKAYNSHDRLTIMVRDPVSHRNGLKYFDKCKMMLFPDFALYLEPPKGGTEREGCLLCLRRDTESKLDASEKATIRLSIKMKLREFNTVLKFDITPGIREETFNKVIQIFQSHKVVVTDRFHGLIFSYIAETPCVLLPTRDHKINSGIEWFKEVKQIRLVKSPSQIPDTLESVLSMKEPYLRIKWKERYFNGVKSKLGL